MRRSFLLLAILAAGVAETGAQAQPAPSGHESHHPGGAPTAAPPAGGAIAAVVTQTAPPTGAAGASPGTSAMMPPAAMAAMAAMMKPSAMAAMGKQAPGCCGGPGQKPFYPALMEMPVLTNDVRRLIRVAAISRLGSGAEQISAGQGDLHHAQTSNDLTAAQTAVGEVRAGLSLASSGASALQALNQSQPPPRIALTWFRRETDVAANGEHIMYGGFRDLSWFHVIAMMLLAGALVAAFMMRRARLQRIDALAQRLDPAAAPAAAGAKPAAAAAPEGAKAKPAAPRSPVPAADAAGSPPAAPAKADPDVKAALVPPAAPKAGMPAKPWKGVLRIKSIFDETPTVKTFRLMEAADGAIPFTFLPGQYASIVSEIDGQKVRRSYTISSSPTQRDYIELTIKREQFGLESRHMHDHARTGDLLEMSAPAGKFFFTGAEAKGIVLIAGGVGITPMMSVLRYLTDTSYAYEIHLIHAVSAPSDLIFREEIEYLTRRHPNVHLVAVVSKPGDQKWDGPTGHLTPEIIAECVPDIEKRRIHLCGPPGMMDAVKYALTQLKVPAEQVKTEDFAPPKGGPVTDKEPDEAMPAAQPEPASPAPAAAPTDSAAAQVPPAVAPEDPAALGESAAADPAAPPSAQATVKFSKSGKTGQLAPDQPVLEAAEAIGVVIDFECRVGICGRCKVPLTEGTVTMAVEDALSAEEKAAGTILACQAKSAGNLVVDA